jgi:uncharacterized repeat protein (TIGR01451 family)
MIGLNLKWYDRIFYLALALALVLSLGARILAPQPAMAQSWPTSWTLVDTDPTNNGSGDDYKDVVAASYNYTAGYLYLRLCMAGAGIPDPTNGEYKWFFDLDGGMGLVGQSVRGSEFMLFVESNNIYLLAAGGDDTYSAYAGFAYRTDPGPVTNSTIAGYRVQGQCFDMYVKLSALGISDLSEIASVFWATDGPPNQNLIQAPQSDHGDEVVFLGGRLLISKTDSPDPVAPGAKLTYTITYQNTGGETAHNVVITETYDGNVTYNSSTPSASGPGHNIWNIGNLTAGSGGTISVNVTVGSVPNGTLLVNHASITCDEALSDNCTAETTVSSVPIPAFYVEKHGSPDPVDAGGTLTYTLNITNYGTGNATGVNITDDYDQSILTITDAGGGTDNGDTIKWSGLNINAGGSILLTVTATVSAGLTGDTSVHNSVAVTCTQGVTGSGQADTQVRGVRPPVGGTAYPINKLVILLPWIALGAAIIAGIIILERRRRKA